MIKYVFVKDAEVFQATGFANGKSFGLGSFDTQELAKEAKNFFNNECGRDFGKYKQSKYWKELRRISPRSEGYEKKGSIEKTLTGSFLTSYFLNGKKISLGTFNNEQLAREAINFFIKECKENLEEYKQSKYWKELRNIGVASKEYEKKGSIIKTSNNAFLAHFLLEGNQIYLGTFKTKELAEEALKYFKEACNANLEKYKESKYWKELRNINVSSKEYQAKGSIAKTKYGKFALKYSYNSVPYDLCSFDTKELAQEALKYFMEECNMDLNKFKQSKYWLERVDKRSTSKSYWEKGKMNKRNTSGITGVRWEESKKYWEACIRINNKKFCKYFQSKENAIKYRDFLVEQGKEFNEKWDEARKQKQMEFIKEQGEKLAQELKNNSDEKKAIEEEKQETQYEFTKVEE